MKTVNFFRLRERHCPYKSMGGRHREHEDDDENHNTPFQLKKGIKVESEHKGTIKFLKHYLKEHGEFPKDRKIYKSIAKEHLKEDPNYYKKLAKIESH